MELTRIIQSGDTLEKAEGSAAIRADNLLSEISRLYLHRCRAMMSRNAIAIELFNHQIADLKQKLRKI